MRKFTNKRWLPSLVGIVVAVLAAIASTFLIKIDHDVHQQQHVARVETKINYFSSRIQLALANNLMVIEAVETLLLLKDDINQKDFELLTTRLLLDRPSIRQAQLAPDAIVRYVYPDVDSRKVIGLNLLNLKNQKQLVQNSIEQGEMILAGPLNLVQGGKGLIARKPLYNQQGARSEFWGFITLIIDLDEIYKEIGLTPNDDLARYALRGADAKGETGDVFYGAQAVFSNPDLYTGIQVPGGNWYLSAKLHAENDFHGIPFPVLIVIVAIASLGLGSMSAITCSALHRTYERSIRDPLTRLPNRQHFQDVAEAEIVRAVRYQLPLSIIMIDLDFFKQINDNFGHQAGDYVLKKSSRMIEALLRESDLAARYGGEEFIILLPHSDEDKAVTCAKRIRAALHRELEFNGEPIALSASLGCASLEPNRDTYDFLVSRADAALLKAKSQGRNRVIAASLLPDFC